MDESRALTSVVNGGTLLKMFAFIMLALAAGGIYLLRSAWRLYIEAMD